MFLSILCGFYVADIIGSIQEEFEISKENDKRLRYISLEIERLDDELLLDQIAYIKELKEMESNKRLTSTKN